MATSRKIQHYIKILKSGDESEREDAINALGEIGPDAAAAVPVVIEAIKEDALCWAAVEALGEIKGKEAMQALSKALLNDTDVGVRMRAAMSLAKISDRESVPTLINALRDRDEMVRSGAVEALGAIGDQTIVPALNEALKDSSQYVRQAATKALERVKAR
jgi:HEAT repeat protein